jgi:hypothetical protein
MLRVKEGDRVLIVQRVPTAADVKSGLYYSYYGGLSGTVFKIYGKGETAQAAIDIDLESLPEDVARRHLNTRDEMVSHLTGEAKRASLPGGEHPFRLRYVLLVAVADLTRKLASPVRQAASGNGRTLAAASN